MAQKKTTPKSRALQRSARQAKSATKRAAVHGTPRVTEAGTAGYNAVQLAKIAAQKLAKQGRPPAGQPGRSQGSSVSNKTMDQVARAVAAKDYTKARAILTGSSKSTKTQRRK